MKIKIRKAAIMQQNNVVDHKRNFETAVDGVESLNIPVVNKYVTAEVKVENEVTAFLWCHCTTTTVDHLSEAAKSMEKAALKLKFFVIEKFGIYLVYF